MVKFLQMLQKQRGLNILSGGRSVMLNVVPSFHTPRTHGILDNICVSGLPVTIFHPVLFVHNSNMPFYKDNSNVFTKNTNKTGSLRF